MGLRTSLSDGDRLLVADTSTIINLNATGCADDILRALPCRIAAAEAVREELEIGRSKGRSDAAKFEALVGSGLIEVVRLGDGGLLQFEGLVIGPASETLDDGEAATIAFAAETGAVAVIDESKALRLCASRFPHVRLGCTVDLFAHPAVQRALGASGLADAVHRALLEARMRVLPHHLPGVLDLIGPKRAAECPSLPRETRARLNSPRQTGRRNAADR